MNEHIDNARRLLAENKDINPKADPVRWNYHNALVSLLKGFEEEVRELKAKISRLEK